jgi:hypothetical protein
MAQMKKPAIKKPMAPRTPSTGVKKPMPKMEGAKPSVKKPMPKTISKAPARTPAKTPVKMTPQDAAMKKILEKKYGKIYG